MFVKCDECSLTVKQLLLTVLQRKSNFVCTISGTEGDKGSIPRLFVPIGFSNQDFNRSFGSIASQGDTTRLTGTGKTQNGSKV